MRKIFTILALSLLVLTATAQQDKRPFHASLYNQEYQLRMPINFYDEDITIPGQELFGTMAGYLCKDGTTYCWLMVKADVQGDTLYTLRHLSGSTLKVPNKGKWQKLPKTLEFRPK